MVDPSGQVIGAGGGVLDAQAESPTVIAAVVARMSAILMYVSFSSSSFRPVSARQRNHRSNVP